MANPIVTLPINPRYIQALSKHVAAAKDIRNYFNGVLIECDGKNLFYVATDGSKMAVLRQPLAEHDYCEPFCVIIDRNAFLKAKIPRKWGLMPGLFEAGQLTCELLGVKTPYVDGKYPRWRSVMPKGIQELPELRQHDGKLLAALDDCYRDAFAIEKSATGTYLKIALGNGHHLSANFALGVHDEFIGIVAPVVTKGEVPTLPSWYEADITGKAQS